MATKIIKSDFSPFKLWVIAAILLFLLPAFASGQYTVTFDAGAGSPVSEIIEEDPGSGIELPETTPSQDCIFAGYEFAGWSKTSVASGTTTPPEYEKGEIFYPTENTTLYAVYKKTGTGTATVDFIMNTAVGSVNTFNPNWERNTTRATLQSNVNGRACVQLMEPLGSNEGEVWTKTTFTDVTEIQFEATSTASPVSKIIKLLCSEDGINWDTVDEMSISPRTTWTLFSFSNLEILSGKSVYLKIRSGTSSIYLYKVSITSEQTSVSTTYATEPDCPAAPVYNITLRPGAGTVSQDYFPNVSILNLPDATLELECTGIGWTFAGWTLDKPIAKTNIIPVFVSNPYIPTEDATLYAVYVKTDNYNYGLVSSAAQLENGQYLIGTLSPDTNEFYFFDGNINNGHGEGKPVGSHETSFIGLPVAGAVEMTFTNTGTAGQYYIKYGDDFLGAAGSGSGNLRLGNEYTAHWNISYSGGNPTLIYSQDFSGSYARLRGYDGSFRTYSTNSGQYVALFKKTPNKIYQTDPVCTAEKYTVSFDAGNGTYTGGDLTEEHSDAGIVLPAATASTACQKEGYVFAGWATGQINETTVRPELFEAGSRYYPASNTTLFAVYIKGQVWQKITTLDEVTEGNYVITFVHATHPGVYYYLPNNPDVSANPPAEIGIMVTNRQLTNAVANNMSWTFTGNNTDGFTISHQVNPATVHTLASTNTAQGISITKEASTAKWKAIQSPNATYNGLLLRGNDGGTRNLSVFVSTAEMATWRYYYLFGSGEYYGWLHLFKYLSYTTYNSNPSCPELYYTITASAGANGSIDPEGAVQVYPEEDQTFTITPDTGYEIDEVLLDGVPVTHTNGTYTIANVNDNHTIHVTFKVSIIFCGGTGEEDDPYLICTPEQLDNVRFALDKHFKLSNDIDLTDYLDGSSQGWLPIGDITFPTVDNPFTGTFNGAGYKITGLWINREGIDNVGLFGYTATGSKIDSLGVEIAFGKEVKGNANVGGLVGWNNSTISNCYVTGKVTGTGPAIGGLAGFSVSSISNCYAMVNVNGDIYVGGLAGYNNGAISYCYATGMVEGNDDFGGLVGWNKDEGTISKSFFDSQTTGQTEGVGKNDGDAIDVTGLLTEQMYVTATFTVANWDFANIWDICEGLNYPTLQWQKAACAHNEFCGGTGTVVSQTWNGNLNGNWDTETQNWYRGDKRFKNDDNVLFGSTLGTTSIQIISDVSVECMTVLGSLDYTFNGEGITGSGRLSKEGSSKLTFANSGNIFAEGTLLSGGEIVIGSSTALGVTGILGNARSGWITFNDNDNDRTLTVASGVSGIQNHLVTWGEEGSGTNLFQNTAGTPLTVTGAQAGSYQGGFADIGGGSALTVTANADMTFTGNTHHGNLGAGTPNDFYVSNASLTFNGSANTFINSGFLGANNATLNKSGAGTLQFGATVNYFHGTATVSGGTFRIVDGLTFGHIIGDFTAQAGANLAGDGKIQSGTITVAGTISPDKATLASGNMTIVAADKFGTLILAGNNITLDGFTMEFDVDANSTGDDALKDLLIIENTGTVSLLTGTINFHGSLKRGFKYLVIRGQGINGYAFNGNDVTQSLTATLNGEALTGATFAVEGKDIYLKLPPCTVTFAGDAIGVIPPQSVAYGGLVTEPSPAPETTGFHIAGWFTDNGIFANKWVFATSTVTQDTTLYIKWEAHVSDNAQASDCTLPNTCIVCGKMLTPAGTHYSDNAHLFNCILPSTCMVCGKIITPASTHTSDNAQLFDCTLPNTCIICGMILKLAGEHTWGDWEITKPATTTETGLETRTCSVCGATETREIPINTGIAKIESAGVKIYPNPTNSILNIELEKEVTNGTLTLYDMSGKAVLLQELNGVSIQINISSLPAGNYILRLIEKGLANVEVQVIKQ